MTRTRRILLGALGAAMAIGAWWASSTAAGSMYYPPLPDVLDSVWSYWVTGDGAEHLAASLATLTAGLVIGLLGGFVLGLLIGQLPALRRALTPSLEFVRAIPATALIPFFMVVLGLGPAMRITIIALGVLFPVLLTTIDGARAISREARDVARAYGITGWTRQRRVVIPAVLPRAAAGAEIAVPLSLVLMVTSEMTGSVQGIGHVLVTAQNSFDQTAVWGAIALLGVLGVLLSGALSLVSHRVLAWDRARNGGTR